MDSDDVISDVDSDDVISDVDSDVSDIEEEKSKEEPRS